MSSVRDALRAVCDPARAAAMQAYMKSEMPYLGVSAPVLRKTCAGLFRGREFGSAEEWQASVLEIWRGAQYREERYAAIGLSGVRQARAFQTVAAMPMYEEMIVSGAWWDYVDTIASHRVGSILRTQPGPMKRMMRQWSRDPNIWKRRTAILCQLGFKEETDLRLLYGCIAPSLGEKEFFLRKAIGWALRQYAWTDATEVRRYVEEMGERLLPLSRREALKNIG